MTRQDSSASESPLGRERLIEAAIKVIGRDGFAATSVRAIADEAGVSWGLIRFYFGSKEGLRDAAEERVVSVYMGLVLPGLAIGSIEDVEALFDARAAELEELPVITDFLRRAILEDRPIARTLIKRLMEAAASGVLADLSRRYPDETWISDPVRRMAQRLGYLMLAPQFKEIMGRDVFSIEELKRRNVQEARVLQLISQGLAAEDRAED